MDALETLFTRRSIRKFTEAPISDEDTRLLLRAAMAAPSARNTQPWRFIVVREQAQREAIAAFSKFAQMAPKAPLCIVVCAEPPTGDDAPEYWPQDCAAAIQNLMLAARAKGIGSVWTGVYPRMDRVKGAKEAFGLPENIMPLGIVVLGYPAQPFAEVDRFDEDKIHYERW